jgi:glucose-1-phosphate adenylyltransferase
MAGTAAGGTSYDFGRDIFPLLAEARVAYAYNFMLNRVPGPGKSEEPPYWRDVGTIEAYFEANLDLKEVDPKLNLYNWKWPIMTTSFYDPPAKFVFDETGRRGEAVQPIITAGCILAGGYAKDSILARNVFLDAGSEVRESILLDNVYIGPGALVRRAIIDKDVRISAGQTIGYDPESDRRKYHISDTGIVVIPKAPGDPRDSRTLLIANPGVRLWMVRRMELQFYYYRGISGIDRPSFEEPKLGNFRSGFLTPIRLTLSPASSPS